MRKTAVMAISWSVAALGVVAVATPAAYADTTTPTAGTTTTTTACDPLPTWVQGRPAHLHVRSAAGGYLWHDDNGWHLRVTHRSKHKKVFTGVITATGPITFARVRDEKRDKAALSNDGTKLVFRFVNYGGIDGVDFGDGCAAHTRFAFAIGGHKATRNQVYIGAHSARPGKVPFTISRGGSASAA